MVKQEALGGDTSACAASTSTKAEGSKSSLGSSETSTSNMISDGDRLRRNNVPNFQPFDTEEARARAAVEQWRTFTMLIEPQPGSPEAASVCEQLVDLATRECGSSCTRFTVMTKDSLAEIATKNGISGKRALAQALVWTMARDREEGLMAKKENARRREQAQLRGVDDEDAANTLDETIQEPHADDLNVVDEAACARLCEADEGKLGDDTDLEGEKEQQMIDILAHRQAEREKTKIQLRAARLFTTADDELGAPDRVYILEGFPGTDSDAAPFLEENHTYYMKSSKTRHSEGHSSSQAEAGEKPGFLSALDAVIQFTTRELVGKTTNISPRSPRRPDSRPGTASSSASTPENTLGSFGEKTTPIAAQYASESTWDRIRTLGNSSAFTQASGATKALAVAQTKGGTMWQDLSFSYVNVLVAEDPSREGNGERPRSAAGKVPKSAEKETARVAAETKDILNIAKEFKEMVTQMAFEKYDFHQWFSTAELVTIPCGGTGVNIAQATAEARAADMGGLTGANGGGGSAARIDGSLWATNPTLFAYSNNMLAVPDELSSVATALYCMVEAVMLECTGIKSQPLDTSPPAPLAGPSDSSADVAPLHDGCVGGPNPEMVSSACHPKDTVPRASGEDSTNGDTTMSTVTHSQGMIPALPRNIILEYGDHVGERATRGALNRAAASGEDRVDPRPIVAVERAALAKLRNPRLVGQGALPREPAQSEKVRGTEQCELLSFTDLGRKDVHRTRQVWALEQLVNAHHSPPGQGVAWNFMNRRYWDLLSPHVVQQVLRAQNGMEPLCLRHYYSPTDELLVALCHDTPVGRARICSWDPCTSGTIPYKYRPSFKDWASMAVAKDLNYTPRTLYALGALMDVSKTDLDRAKTKSIKIFPADRSLVILSGFVATGERWLSTFKDEHVMGLRLSEADTYPSRVGAPEAASRSEQTPGPSKGNRSGQATSDITGSAQFAAQFTMGFDDDSRLVVKEGVPAPPPVVASRPTSSAGKGRKSNACTASDSAFAFRKPDGFGTVSCVHTFRTGLVVTTNSDGTVAMRFVLDSKRSRGGKLLAGFVPQAARDELSRAVVESGTVVRHMRDGSTQMLFVTGDVVTRRGNEMTLTDKNGISFNAKASTSTIFESPELASHTTISPRMEWILVPPSSVATDTKSDTAKDGKKVNTLLADKLGKSPQPKSSASGENPVRDVETGSSVWRPRGGTRGRVVVICEDGVTITRHTDGTVQRWRCNGGQEGSKRGSVLVECDGFASVEVDLENQELCDRHARGSPVTVTRGGNVVRLRIVMPNGGATLVTYDTRVTSQVCGRVVYVHSDNTEVIASDRGEVVVRPRGLWMGRPVHSILAGPNSSMPPNCAQPDLLVGAYLFDCLKGVMETEDTDRNRFVLDITKTAFLREGFTISREGGSRMDCGGDLSITKEKGGKVKQSSSRPSSGKSEGVTIDLSGEAAGVRSDAQVDNPLEPRLFVYRRDGSALELLRNDDARTWCESFAHPQDIPARRIRAKGDEKGVEGGPWDRPSMSEDTCVWDPHSQGARQLNFHVPLLPVPRGEGAFVALLQRRSGDVLGDGYGVDGGGGTFPESWRTRPFPLAARSFLGSEAGMPGCGPSTALQACVRRVWLEHPPLSTEAAEGLKRSLAQWDSWRKARVEQIDRFSVFDPRTASEIDAQKAVQKLVRKAFREAKAARQKQKEKARAARAQAARAQQAMQTASSRSAGTATGTATGTTASLEEMPTMESSTLESVDEIDHNDDSDVDFPSSGDEEEDEETLSLREEVASAYASAGGDTKGHLDIPALRTAMVMVLGRAVRESEAESRLCLMRKRAFPDQLKASQSDLFRLLVAARDLGSEESHRMSSPPRFTGMVIEDQSGRSPVRKSQDLACAASLPGAVSAPDIILLKPLHVPKNFWDTEIGRSLKNLVVSRKLGVEEDANRGRDTRNQNGKPANTDDEAERRLSTTAHLNSDAGIADANETSPFVMASVGDIRGLKSTHTSNQEGEPRPIIHKPPPLAPATASVASSGASAAVLPRGSHSADPDHPQASWLRNISESACSNDNMKECLVENGGKRLIGNHLGYSAVLQLQNGDAEGVESLVGGWEGAAGERGDITSTDDPDMRPLGILPCEADRGTPRVRGHKSRHAEKSRDKARSRGFEVTPHAVSLGSIEVGRAQHAKIQIANVTDKPARFRMDDQSGAQAQAGGCVRVADYPRGKVAAGLAVVAHLEVLAVRPGLIQETVRVIAEDGITEIVIDAEAVEGDRRPVIAPTT